MEISSQYSANTYSPAPNYVATSATSIFGVDSVQLGSSSSHDEGPFRAMAALKGFKMWDAYIRQ